MKTRLFLDSKLPCFSTPFLRRSAYMAKASKLRTFESKRSGSMFRDFQILDLYNLSNNVIPSIFRKNLISDVFVVISLAVVFFRSIPNTQDSC